MKAEIAGQEIEFEVSRGEPAYDAAARAADAAKSVIDAEISKVPPRQYDRSSEPFDRDVLAEVAEAYLTAVRDWLAGEGLPETAEKPSHVAEDAMAARLDDNGHFYEAVYGEEVAQGPLWRDVRAAVASAIAEADPEFDEIRAEELAEESIREVFEQSLRESDPSRPLDVLDDSDMVEVCYVAGAQGGLDAHDLAMDHYSVAFGPETVIPNENFANFLRFANLSSEEYLDVVKRNTGKDLRAKPDRSECAGDLLYERAVEMAEMWQGFSVEKADPSKPALFGEGKLIDVMENASYGGVGTFAMSVPAPKLFHMFDKTPAANPKVVAGGQAGIHDFINGSGHLESPDAEEVELDLSKGALKASGGAVDRVYGFTRQALATEIERGSYVPAKPQNDETPTP